MSYILEAVSRRRNSFDISPDSKIEDLRSTLDKSGFYEKSVPGTGSGYIAVQTEEGIVAAENLIEYLSSENFEDMEKIRLGRK